MVLDSDPGSLGQRLTRAGGRESEGQAGRQGLYPPGSLLSSSCPGHHRKTPYFSSGCVAGLAQVKAGESVGMVVVHGLGLGPVASALQNCLVISPNRFVISTLLRAAESSRDLSSAGSWNFRTSSQGPTPCSITQAELRVRARLMVLCG